MITYIYIITIIVQYKNVIIILSNKKDEEVMLFCQLKVEYFIS